MRVPLWALALLLFLLGAGLFAMACGGSNAKSGQVSGDIPTATLPSTLPDPLIVSGTPRPSSGAGKYAVKSGDSPSSIAAHFGIPVDDLIAANGITDPTSLQVGQELVIPGAQQGQALAPTATPPATAEAATATPAPPTGRQTYTVRDGDIPETIAAQFGITAQELMEANGITDPASLQVGQELVIPTPQPGG